MKPVTIRDIAQVARVSHMKVSRALSNKPHVSELERQRILRIAAELGYRPKPMVSALMSQVRAGRSIQHGDMLAWVSGHPQPEGWRSIGISNQFYQATVKAVEDLGFQLDTLWTREPGMTRERLRQIIEARNIRGLFFAPLPAADFGIDIDLTGLAAVSFGYTLKSPVTHRATSHHLESAQKAFHQLTCLGYKKIGFYIKRDVNNRLTRLWEAAALLYGQERPANMRIPPMILEDLFSPKLKQWLEKYQPDALISDQPGNLRAIKQTGWAGSKKVAFASLFVHADQQEVAGIDQCPSNIVAAAVDLMVEQLNHNELGVPHIPRIVQVGGIWVDGATAPAKYKKE